MSFFLFKKNIFDTTMEILSLLILLGLWIFVMYNFGNFPEMLPPGMEVTKYTTPAHKNILWFLMGRASFSYLMITGLDIGFSKMNLETPEKEKQFQLGMRIALVTKFLLQIMFVGLIAYMIGAF